MAHAFDKFKTPSGKKENPFAKFESPARQEKSDFDRPITMKDIEAARKRPSGAGAFIYGRATGLLGAPGDIEEIVTQTVPRALGKVFPQTMGSVGRKGLYDASTVLGDTSKTFLPTTEMVRQAGESVGIPRPPRELSAYQTAGEISPLVQAVPKLAKYLIGETGRIGEETARLAEKMGFKLSAQQVARKGPTVQRGAAGWSKSNQELANRKAAEATGKSAAEVDEKFINSRLEDLGQEFDNLYKGKQFNIDQGAINAISQISANEAAAIGPSGVSTVKSAADDILRAYRSLVRQPGAAQGTFAVTGEGLQRLRNALSARAASASGQSKHEIYNLIDEIDASVERNHPAVAKALSELRPKYRAAVILEDLTSRGGIDRGDISLNRLGEMLRGISIRRKTEQAIDLLGRIGKGTNLIALWERPGEAVAETGKSVQSLADALGVGTLGRIVTSPARTRGVRAIQRSMAGKVPTRGSVVQPMGVAARIVNPEDQ
jgi:hypothetical protein